MKRRHRKALKYAFRALRGDYEQNPGPALRGDGLIDPDRPISRFANHWLQPDGDPDRPYLDESACVYLEMRGYMECRRFTPGPVWLYRITPEGCLAIGKSYPVKPFLPRHQPRPPFPHVDRDSNRRHRVKLSENLRHYLRSKSTHQRW